MCVQCGQGAGSKQEQSRVPNNSRKDKGSDQGKGGKR